MNKIKLNWKDSKTLLFLAILLVVIFFIVKYAINKFQKTTTEKLIDSSTNEVVTSSLSYSDSDYLRMAEQLKAAVGLFWNDSDIIISVFNQLKTKSDWLKLIGAFGERSAGPLFPNHTLIEWIDKYYSSDERTKINQVLNKFNVSI